MKHVTSSILVVERYGWPTGICLMTSKTQFVASNQRPHTLIRTLTAGLLLVGLLLFGSVPQADAKPKGKQISTQEVRRLVADNFPAHARNRAVKIVFCESTNRPGVISKPNTNGSRDWGLWQINDGGTMQGLGISHQEALNPAIATRAAARLWKQSGGSFRSWSCNKKV